MKRRGFTTPLARAVALSLAGHAQRAPNRRAIVFHMKTEPL
jgi:hypothetical protein